MKICIVGTTQSGSTRLFNLVRMLYELEGKRVLSMWNYDNKVVKNKGDYDVILSKVHDCKLEYLKEFDKVLLPVRNIIDSAISNNKRFGSDIKGRCLRNIYLINKFEKVCDMKFRYERYSVSHIMRLCKVLGLKEKSVLEIMGIMKELEGMLNDKNMVLRDDYKDEKYRRTLLTRGHNTSGGLSNKYVTELSMAELEDLLKDEKIRDFIMKYQGKNELSIKIDDNSGKLGVKT